METIPKVASKNSSFDEHNTTLPKKLSAKDIISNIEPSFITNSIDPKRISKESTKSLTMGSAVKAILVFAGMIGSYYLAKTTGIFPF
jgi:hypothetical protein